MKIHVAIGLDYLLRSHPDEAILKDGQTGKTLPSAEVKARAAILKARGYEVMPIACDNHDDRGYCKGHQT
jgi:hypothetical protein